MIRKFKYFARLAKDDYLRPQKIVFFWGGGDLTPSLGSNINDTPLIVTPVLESASLEPSSIKIVPGV